MQRVVWTSLIERVGLLFNIFLNALKLSFGVQK